MKQPNGDAGPEQVAAREMPSAKMNVDEPDGAAVLVLCGPNGSVEKQPPHQGHEAGKWRLRIARFWSLVAFLLDPGSFAVHVLWGTKKKLFTQSLNDQAAMQISENIDFKSNI